MIISVAAGKDAAVSIDRYLRDVDLREGRAIRIKRLHEVPKESPKKRVGASMDEKAAVAEAKRCFNCGVCAEGIEEGLQPACVKACPSHCIYFGNIYEITQKLGRNKIR